MSISKIASVVAGLALAALASSASAQTTSCYSFTINHKLGNVGGEVMSVQKFLNMNAATQIAASGAGSAGMETTRFGGLTKAAVMKFQAANGVSPVSGYWGPLTRAKANALEAARCASNNNSNNNNTTPATGDAVLAAAAQPGNSLAPAGAARVPFTKFTVTAGANPVTLNSVTVERGGLANDLSFANIILLDENGQQLGIEKVLNSNHQATIGSPVVIPAGSTKTFTVAANMNATTTASAGQVAVFSVVSANTSGTVGGSLPITGAQHTINASLALGKVTAERGPQDPAATVNKEIGTTNYTFASYKLTAGSEEKVRVWGIRVNQSGSVATSDLANIKMIVDGTEYMPTWSADGKYAQFNFAGGIVIDKGLSKEFVVKADIAGGSGRTISMDIYRLTDIQATGETYGYGITPTAGSNFSSTANPAYNNADVTVNAGSFSAVTKSSLAPAANIATQKSDETLGAFTVDLKGEKVQVQSAVFNITVTNAGGSSTPTVAGITNIKLVDQNGAVLAGPVDGVGTGLTGTATFSALTFPAGTTTVYVKGQLNTNYENNDTVSVATTPSSNWTAARGETSGNNVALPASLATANTMTVKAASLLVAKSTSPIAQTQVAGANDVVFTTIQFDASQSGEDVRFNTIPVTFATPANLSNCRVYDGATNMTTGSNSISTPGASGTFVLDNLVTVTKGQVKNLDIKCNILGSATGTSNVGLGTPSSISASGANSGVTVTPTGSAIAGNTMTIGVSAVAVSTDPSSPSAGIVAGGASNVTLGAWKLRATNDSATVRKIGMTLAAGGLPADVTSVTLYNGSTPIGTANFVGSGTTQAVQLTTPLTLAKDADTVITVKGSLSAIGGSNPGTTNDSIKINWDNTAANNEFTGVGSGATITPTGSTSVAGVRIFKSVPVVADDSASLGSVGASDGKLARFKVTADAAGSIAVGKLSVKVTYSAATVANAKVFAFTNASYSTPKSGLFQTDGQIAATQGTVTSGTAFVVDASATPVQVGAGETVYFEVRGDVVASTGASVVTVVEGDATANPAAGSALVAAGSVTGKFVWTPNTNGTSAAATTDWVNGAEINGLPSSGISKARGL